MEQAIKKRTNQNVKSQKNIIKPWTMCDIDGSIYMNNCKCRHCKDVDLLLKSYKKQPLNKIILSA